MSASARKKIDGEEVIRVIEIRGRASGKSFHCFFLSAQSILLPLRRNTIISAHLRSALCPGFCPGWRGPLCGVRVPLIEGEAVAQW
jgi:hypothetical protein